LCRTASDNTRRRAALSASPASSERTRGLQAQQARHHLKIVLHAVMDSRDEAVAVHDHPLQPPLVLGDGARHLAERVGETVDLHRRAAGIGAEGETPAR